MGTSVRCRYPSMRELASYLMLVAPVICRAQTPPHLDGHRLPARTDTLIEYVVKGADTVRSGYVIDQIAVSDSQIIRHYAGRSKAMGELLDSIVDRARDLRPLSIDEHSSGMAEEVHFGADSATGWMRTPGGDSVAVRESLPRVVYDGSSFDLVVRASDLADGFALTVPVFEVGSNAVSSVGGRVTGAEVVAGHECWVFKGHFSAMSVTLWIDKQSRQLVQQYLQPSVNFGILLTAAHYKARGMPET